MRSNGLNNRCKFIGRVIEDDLFYIKHIIFRLNYSLKPQTFDDFMF